MFNEAEAMWSEREKPCEQANAEAGSDLSPGIPSRTLGTCTPPAAHLRGVKHLFSLLEAGGKRTTGTQDAALLFSTGSAG